MFMNRSKNGITLVSLIITVIVLLILATVSISLIINSGILDHAQHGVDRYSEEEELEQIKLAVASAQLKGNGFITTENLNSELQEKFGEEATELSGFWYYKGNRIYENGEVKAGSVLPKEYQQVEYIESTGTEYIDTGVIPSVHTDIKLKCYVPFNSTNTKSIYWTRRHNLDMEFTSFGLILNSKSNIRAYRLSQGDSSVSTNLGNTLSNEIIYETKGDSYTINNSTYTFCSPEIDSLDYSIYLFGLNQNGSNYSFTAECGIKLYYFKIYENNGLVRDFTPCYRKSDNQPGLYDTVEGKFYTNQGSGEFYLPPEKKLLPKEYQQVEYIESTGTQYIDTETTQNNQCSIFYDANVKWTASGGIVGAFTRYKYGFGLCMIQWNGNPLLCMINENETRCPIDGEFNFNSIWSNRHQFYLTRSRLYLDDVFVGELPEVDTICTTNCYLFGMSGTSLGKTRQTLYNAKLYNEDNEIIRNFVPCYSTTTVTDVDGIERPKDTIGLYDTVEGKFYVNKGTGTFLKGANV